jgi:small subunit ribosomal protein S20
MPVGRSAKKKLRQDKKRQKQNLLVKENIKRAIKEFKAAPKKSLFARVFSLLDQAVKKKIFHINKSARLKSNLSKLLRREGLSASPPQTAKKTSSRKRKNIV